MSCTSTAITPKSCVTAGMNEGRMLATTSLAKIVLTGANRPPAMLKPVIIRLPLNAWMMLTLVNVAYWHVSPSPQLLACGAVVIVRWERQAVAQRANV
jgi:hypothetical protein